MSQVCERCKHPTIATICSYFNTEQICLACEAREKTHPDYREARAAELTALRLGEYNFPGIGLPSELRREGS